MAAGANVITLPNIDLRIYNDMTVGRTTDYENTIRLNSASQTTLIINNNLNVNAGTLQYRNDQAQAIVVDNDVLIAGGATLSVRNGGTVRPNTLTISGNLTNNGTLTLLNGAYYCDLTFSGNTDKSFSGTGVTTLNNLIIDKGVSQSAILTMDLDVSATLTTLTNDWLTLSNGTFRFASPSKSITLTDDWNAVFTIPSTACLSVNGIGSQINIAYQNDNDCDLLLSGKLEVKTGTINIGNTANNRNNDIEYAAAGSPEISIETGGILNVNGQIRYSLSSTSGSLIYNQSGGDVTIFGRNHDDSRAKLAVHNPGSIFNMSGGTITIETGDGTTYSDLYLRPESSTVTGGTIIFNTDGTEIFKIDANVPIYNLSLTGSTSNTTNISVSNLELLGSLSIDANSELIANNLDVSVGGNFTLNGTYTPGTNTTLFNGSGTQTITLNNALSFYNFTINNTGSVNLAGTDNPIVTNNFNLLSGTFDNIDNNIYIRGNATNSSTHACTGTGIMYFDGNNPQIISGNGSGQFARITIDNADGINLNTDIIISDQLDFNDGMVYSEEFLLTFTADAPVPTNYDETKFIATSGVSSDKGIRKELNAGDNDFTFPIGSVGSLSNKYTPAVFDLDGVTGTEPYIQLRPINSKHLATTDAGDTELEYYWNLSTSTGMAVTAISHAYTYLDEDIQGTEGSYIAARLPYGDAIWVKDGAINTGTNTITFTNISDLNGDYTAGEVLEFATSWVFRSYTDGNWTTQGT